ncbi:MAG TPA: GntR family transcriptional regulator [Rhodoglobus sp.]|nr:GntR family transcriptional regulator [Rhodoglobus sp.]
MNVVSAKASRAPRAEGSSRTDEAFQRLRADILHGRLEPGSRLRVESLSKDYGVSSGVIREALPRLVGQGLAVAVPQQGVRVVSVDLEDLLQLTDAEVELETLVLRRSLAEGTVEWESTVMAAHHRLSRLVLRDDDGSINDDWATAHNHFHMSILDGCTNRRLTGLAASLRDAGEVYRRWADRPAAMTEQQHVDNHRRICDLVVERNADAAVAELRQHIELTTQLILAARAADGPDAS